MAVATLGPAIELDAKHLLDSQPGAWEDLVAYIVNHTEGWAPDYAAAVLNEALRFLSFAASNDGLGLAPSSIVDVAVDAIYLNTPVARKLFQELGRFVDHVPLSRGEQHERGAELLEETLRAMRRHQRPLDASLWPMHDSASCWDGTVKGPECKMH